MMMQNHCEETFQTEDLVIFDLPQHNLDISVNIAPKVLKLENQTVLDVFQIDTVQEFETQTGK